MIGGRVTESCARVPLQAGACAAPDEPQLRGHRPQLTRCAALNMPAVCARAFVLKMLVHLEKTGIRALSERTAGHRARFTAVRRPRLRPARL